MEVATHDLEHSLHYFVAFGKLIGIYPSRWNFIRLIPALLAVVTIVDWVGCFFDHSLPKYVSAVDICGKIGSPQFYTLGTFCYLCVQRNHGKLIKIYENWKKIPVICQDTHLSRFVNLVTGIIMTSAVLENICFHFKLFPVFEAEVKNKTSFEVYYERSHSYWSHLVPFTPFQATLLLITNKLALYAWNYVDLLVIVTCRALAFRFEALSKNIDILDPENAMNNQMGLMELMKLLENYLSPLLFGSFYVDFYATCMQLHMWMTPAQHAHFLHTVYLLWAFVHLMVRIFLLSYQASRLHEVSGYVQLQLQSISGRCSNDLEKRIWRMEWSARRQLAISGLGCFFVTKRFLLTLIYVAFSFQIFLLQSETAVKC